MSYACGGKEMSPEELNSLLRGRPFMPFRIHVAEQATYEIRNPEMAVIGRTVLFLGMARDVDSPYFDEPVLVTLRHTTQVEPIVEAAAAG